MMAQMINPALMSMLIPPTWLMVVVKLDRQSPLTRV
jgi:hypothetical protein